MNLLIIGIYEQVDKALLNFQTSCHKTNIKLIQVTPQSKYRLLIKEVSRNLEKVICIVNVSEALNCASKKEWLDKFYTFNKPIVFGTQGSGIELKKWWGIQEQKRHLQNLKIPLSQRKDLSIPNNQFININGFIGYASTIIIFLKFILKSKVVYEEHAFSYFIELNPKICALDTKSKLFGNITCIDILGTGDMIYMELLEKRVRDVRSLEYPCLVNFVNSRQDMHMRMYRYGIGILGDKLHYNIDVMSFFLLVINILPFMFINRFNFSYTTVLLLVGIYIFYYFFCLYL